MRKPPWTHVHSHIHMEGSREGHMYIHTFTWKDLEREIQREHDLANTIMGALLIVGVGVDVL